MTPTQAGVSAICVEVLGLDGIEVDDDLYGLGSDSHQAVVVALEIERVFAVDLPLEIMESGPTVRTLSAWIDERLAQPKPHAATPVVASGDLPGDG